MHTDGKDVLEFLYFVEAGDTGKEPVAYIRAKQYGGPGEPIFIDGEEEEIGRVSKMVYSYVRNVNNGYMLVKKGKLHLGDKFRIHGYECVVTEKNWL